MTERATLEALLARVLEGTGPDRELDVEIARMIGLRVVEEGHPIGRQCYDKSGLAVDLRRYTTSLDAALTLVPKGWLYEIHSGNDEDWAEVTLFPYLAKATFWTRAATPARALIAACLKARMGAQPSSNT